MVRAEEQDLSPAMSGHIKALKSEIDQGIRRLIREGVQDGSIHPCDPKMTAFALAGALNWIAHWYRENQSMTGAGDRRRLRYIFENGLRPRAVAEAPHAAPPHAGPQREPAEGACLTNDRLLRPIRIGIFLRSFSLHMRRLCAGNDRGNLLIRVALATAIISKQLLRTAAEDHHVKCRYRLRKAHSHRRLSGRPHAADRYPARQRRDESGHRGCRSEGK